MPDHCLTNDKNKNGYDLAVIGAGSAGFSAATVVFVAAAPLVTFAPDTMVEDNVPGVQENDGDLD